MSPEEAFAELEKKVAHLERTLNYLCARLATEPDVPVAVSIAAGAAWNVSVGND